MAQQASRPTKNETETRSRLGPHRSPPAAKAKKNHFFSNAEPQDAAKVSKQSCSLWDGQPTSSSSPSPSSLLTSSIAKVSQVLLINTLTASPYRAALSPLSTLCICLSPTRIQPTRLTPTTSFLADRVCTLTPSTSNHPIQPYTVAIYLGFFRDTRSFYVSLARHHTSSICQFAFRP